MLFTSSIDNIPNIHVVLFFPCAWTFFASVWRWIFRLDDRFRLIKDSGIYPRDMQALGMKEVFPGSRSIFVSLIPLSEMTGDISGLSTDVCFTPSSLSPYNWFIFHILGLLANIKRWCTLYSATSTSNVMWFGFQPFPVLNQLSPVGIRGRAGRHYPFVFVKGD